MKIAEFQLYKYALPLKQPLVIGLTKLEQRRGCVIELKDESGALGFGEAAPLDGYSDESFTEVKSELLRLRHSLVGYEIPENLEELSGGFERWLDDHKLSPSVRFGFESAVLSLVASQRQVSLARLLSDNPLDNLPINALLNGSRDAILSQVQSRLEDRFTMFKLKVGRGTIDENIQLTRDVRKLIGPDASLHLDANRRWTQRDYQQFADGVRDCDIAYIEEPLSTFSALKVLVESHGVSLPLALDESLRKLTPETLNDWQGVNAIVVKPTVLGLERAVRFVRAASRLGIAAVFSSSYESSLGLATIAQVASAFNVANSPTGLDTVGIFQEDLLSKPLNIQNGRVAVGELPIIAESINRSRLEEIADA